MTQLPGGRFSPCNKCKNTEPSNWSQYYLDEQFGQEKQGFSNSGENKTMDPDNIRTNLHVKNHKRGLNAVDEVKCPILKEFNENKWDILMAWFELKRKQLLFLCFWYTSAVFNGWSFFL
jgi:hypothetical protein